MHGEPGAQVLFPPISQTGAKPEESNDGAQSNAHENHLPNSVSHKAKATPAEDNKQSSLAPAQDGMTIEEAQALPKLLLEVQEGPVLEPGTRYLLTARGYPNSKRNIPDGMVYFGKQDADEATGESKNDIVLSSEEPGIGLMHFVIQFNRTQNAFAVKDLGQGSGTFIKIQAPLKLTTGNVIAFGESHMAVDMLLDGKIQLKFLEGAATNMTR